MDNLSIKDAMKILSRVYTASQEFQKQYSELCKVYYNELSHLHQAEPVDHKPYLTDD
jgi:hypothetical protein